MQQLNAAFAATYNSCSKWSLNFIWGEQIRMSHRSGWKILSSAWRIPLALTKWPGRRGRQPDHMSPLDPLLISVFKLTTPAFLISLFHKLQNALKLCCFLLHKQLISYFLFVCTHYTNLYPYEGEDNPHNFLKETKYINK